MGRYSELDISKSKKRRKVVLKVWIGDQILEWAIYIYIAGVFPFMSIYYLLNGADVNQNFLSAILFFIVSLFFSIPISYSILTLNSLKRISGTEKDTNREIIKGISEDFNWIIRNHNARYTRATAEVDITSNHFGRRLIIIYDKSDILINCTTYARMGLQSPFHWLSNRKIEKALEKEFSKRAEATVATIQ